MVLITASTEPFPLSKDGYKNGILAKYFVLHENRMLLWAVNMHDTDNMLQCWWN